MHIIFPITVMHYPNSQMAGTSARQSHQSITRAHTLAAITAKKLSPHRIPTKHRVPGARARFKRSNLREWERGDTPEKTSSDGGVEPPPPAGAAAATSAPEASMAWRTARGLVGRKRREGRAGEAGADRAWALRRVQDGRWRRGRVISAAPEPAPPQTPAAAAGSGWRTALPSPEPAADAGRRRRLTPEEAGWTLPPGAPRKLKPAAARRRPAIASRSPVADMRSGKNGV